MAKIALIGDLHGNWDDADVCAFNASDYDLLLFTGDLGSGTGQNGVKIARSIARLTKQTIVMPGNNDADFLPEISAEFGHRRGIAELMASVEDGDCRVRVCSDLFGEQLERGAFAIARFAIREDRRRCQLDGHFAIRAVRGDLTCDVRNSPLQAFAA